MQAPTTRVGKALYFANVLGDTAPLCLDWTKVSVALSTCFTAITGCFTAVEQAVGSAAHTPWALLASAIGFHGLSHGIYRVKQMTSKGDDPPDPV